MATATDNQLPPTEITALLGRGTRFEGKLHFDGRVRVDVEAVEVLTLLNAVMRGPVESTRMLEIVLAGVRVPGDGRG